MKTSNLSERSALLLEQELERGESARLANEKAIETSKEQQAAASARELTGPVYISPKDDNVFRGAYMAFGSILFSPNRFRRLSLWFFNLPIRVVPFLSAICGPRVSNIELGNRWKECGTCSQHLIQPGISKGESSIECHLIQPGRSKGGFIIERHYCGGCGCPKWKYAELGFKNKLKNWKCPERKHKGKYPGDWYREYLKNHPDRQPTRKSCGGK